jgi:linoleoyl-CoA desaturase
MPVAPSDTVVVTPHSLPLRPKYPKHGPMRAALNRQVAAYFEGRNGSRSGGVQLLFKALIMLAWFWASYFAMLLWAGPWWQVLPCAVSLGLAVAGIGFSVMHDGGHGASSRRPWLNRLAARAADMVGASSHVWAFKHNVIHHQYPNVDGVDDDLEAGVWLRLAESQPHRRFHRWQHVYFPLAYAFLMAKWLLFDDFRALLTWRLGSIPVPKLKPAQVVETLAWKAFALGWALVLPIAVHGPAWALATFAIWTSVAGVVLSMVFQLAHCVEEAEITPLPPEGARISRSWAQQQLATTADFAPRNRLLTWYLGGLNFQIEHHLFPRISHVHYPKIAPIVQAVSAEFGEPYHVQPTLFAAIASHTSHLRQLGRPRDIVPEQPEVAS